MEGGRRWTGRMGLQPWPEEPRSWPCVLWSCRREWSHLCAFQQLHSSLLPQGLRKHALGKFVQDSPGFPCCAEPKRAVQRVRDGLHSLPG